MSVARNAILGLGVLAHLTVVGGVLLQNLPVDELTADPPVLSVGLATGVFVAYLVVVGMLFGNE